MCYNSLLLFLGLVQLLKDLKLQLVDTFLEISTAWNKKWKSSNKTNRLFEQFLFLNAEEWLLQLQLLKSQLLES